MSTPDPRLGRVVALPDALVVKASLPLGRLPRRAPRPSEAQIEVERSLWGPHPDKGQSVIEDYLFALGSGFLRQLLSAVLGEDVRGFQKAEGGPPKPPGWGEVMALFKSPAPPAEKLSTWKTLLDGFAEALLPPASVENVVASWALRAALLHQIGERVNSLVKPGAAASFLHTLPASQAEAIEWSKLRGAEFVTNMNAKARAAVLDALVESQMAGGNHHDLSRVLFERLGVLNRDWRRIAITETGMAVASGQLATALVAGGEWEAIWVAGPRACPFCRSKNGVVLRVVSPALVDKNGQTMVWPGKNNVGRSMHPYRKDGTPRSADELWWPCIPAHPNCACSWVVRRVLSTPAAQKAAAALAAKRAQTYAKTGVQH